jgi:hypothetical protein
MLQLGSQNRDTIAANFSDQVDNPEKEAQTAEAENANDQSYDVLGLNKANDAINTTDQRAQEDLENDFDQLGQSLVRTGERTAFCHDKYSYS